MAAIVVLTGVVEKEDDQFAAFCLELGTATQGDTEEEAWANLQEAVQGEIELLGELGELDHTFKERGIKVWAVERNIVPYRDLAAAKDHLAENARVRVICPSIPGNAMSEKVAI